MVRSNGGGTWIQNRDATPDRGCGKGSVWYGDYGRFATTQMARWSKLQDPAVDVGDLRSLEVNRPRKWVPFKNCGPSGDRILR